MTETKLRFRKASTNPMEVFNYFYPGGKTRVNSAVWRGKEPRTCAVTGVKSRSRYANDPTPYTFDIEVTYRPPGFITYVGNTRYIGWAAMVLDRAKDGTLLDGKGMPLPEGRSPVYIPHEVYHGVDFNDLDFGRFESEQSVTLIPTMTYDQLMERMHEEAIKGKKIIGTMTSGFAVARRHRPMKKILVTKAPAVLEVRSDVEVIVVPRTVENFEHVLLIRLTELMTEFLEGKANVKSLGIGDDSIFVQLSDALVDASGPESRFDVFNEFAPDTFLEDLAKQMMARFLVSAEVVTGNDCGLLFRKLIPAGE